MLPPVYITLKDPGHYPPTNSQYSFKEEAKNRLQPITDELIQYRLLKSCQPPYKTPILPVLKPSRGYQLV